MNCQLKVLFPAAARSLLCETSAVEPKPSAGTVSLTTVRARRVLAKFVAAALLSIARRTSLPPAMFRPLLGTTKGSPAVAWSDPAGIFGDAVTVNSLHPVIWKSAFVCDFISFSIQPPDGYRRASWVLDHCAWAAVNWVPEPPGFI